MEWWFYSIRLYQTWWKETLCHWSFWCRSSYFVNTVDQYPHQINRTSSGHSVVPTCQPPASRTLKHIALVSVLLLTAPSFSHKHRLKSGLSFLWKPTEFTVLTIYCMPFGLHLVYMDKNKTIKQSYTGLWQMYVYMYLLDFDWFSVWWNIEQTSLLYFMNANAIIYQ